MRTSKIPASARDGGSDFPLGEWLWIWIFCPALKREETIAKRFRKRDEAYDELIGKGVKHVLFSIADSLNKKKPVGTGLR